MDFSRMGVRVLVKDFQGSFDFYKDKLGLFPIWGDRNGPYTSFATEEGGTPKLALFLAELNTIYQGYAAPGDGARGDAVPDRVQLIIPSDDVDRDYEALKAKGVAFIGPPQTIDDWMMRCAWFRDNEGNLIEINDGDSA